VGHAKCFVTWCSTGMKRKNSKKWVLLLASQACLLTGGSCQAFREMVQYRNEAQEQQKVGTAAGQSGLSVDWWVMPSVLCNGAVTEMKRKNSKKWVLLLARVGRNRIYTVYDHIFGDDRIFGDSCQKYRMYTVYIWFWPWYGSHLPKMLYTTYKYNI